MKDKEMAKKLAGITLTASFSMSLAGHALANEQFTTKPLKQGYMTLAEHHGADAKCGSGKCGSDKKSDGKCGSGKCGSDKKSDGKCGSGKCGSDKKSDGKCGSGKCGSDKKSDGKCGSSK